MRRASSRIPSAATRLPRIAVLVLVLASVSFADVYLYEASSSFPEAQGWQRYTECTPERWLEGGWLHQHVEPGGGDCFDPPGGDLDFYSRSIAEFDGESAFYVEWIVAPNGDSSEFPWGGPAALVAGNQGGETYWFAIARDQVKFVQDDFTVILFVDITPDVPHTHRLEIYGDQVYDWYIDGEITYSGTPGGPYPSANPSIIWAAKSAFTESTVEWDYIRYGTIPADGSGDFDSDGEVNDDDVYFFQECLLGPSGSWPGCAWGDIDFSGATDCDDWFLFLEAWTDPADPPGMPECANPPDFDGDGSVNAFDLAILLGSWGPCPDPDDCPTDLDGDGQVNAFDLAILLGSWG